MAQTAPSKALSQNESIALVCAVFGHALLLAVLAWQRPGVSPPLPERMTVTISDESALVSTSPESQAEPAPDTGPVLGEAAPPPEPAPVAEPEPQVQPKPAPVPMPKVAAKVPPRPVPPKPVAKPVAKPAAKPAAKPSPPTQKPRTTGKPGSTDFDRAFAGGIPGGKPGGKATNPPAQATGAQKSSWSSLIGNKVLRHWNGCSVTGLEVEKLRIDVRFVLSINGGIESIADPVVTGITPANRAQVTPFKNCAIRAIRLAAPFAGMPPEFYNDWKVRNLRLRKE